VAAPGPENSQAKVSADYPPMQITGMKLIRNQTLAERSSAQNEARAQRAAAFIYSNSDSNRRF